MVTPKIVGTREKPLSMGGHWHITSVGWGSPFMLRVELTAIGFAAGTGEIVMSEPSEGPVVPIGVNWEPGAFASVTGASISGGTMDEVLSSGGSRTSGGGFESSSGPAPENPAATSVTDQTRSPSGSIVTSYPGGPASVLEDEIAQFLGRIPESELIRYKFSIGGALETGGEGPNTLVTARAGCNINIGLVRRPPDPGDEPDNEITFTVTLPTVQASDASVQVFWHTQIVLNVSLLRLVVVQNPGGEPTFTTLVLSERSLNLGADPDHPDTIGGTVTFTVDVQAKEITEFIHA